ncbi:MAG: sulfite exporter TauE/SafE family protein [Proteobacteria bacterium]|nr:sulfite exporter TauE/SafE family protein [Pseudomonadota bacterium]
MEALLAHCASTFSTHSGLFAVFFFGGLTGGFTHCLSMCGPMAACQSFCASGCGKRLGTAQFSHHLGRAISYGFMGFASALLSKQVAAFHWWPATSALMLALAGTMFLASSLPACRHRPAGGPTFLRGVLLGFMPCGLLYAALMMAATLTDPFGAMLAMWLFALGTVPALLVAGLGAELVSRKWKNIMHCMGRTMLACKGLSLLVMAASIVR